MEITKIICNKNFQIDKVDSRLFGSFLEHIRTAGDDLTADIQEYMSRIILILMKTDLEKMC